jgi:hypothetical protein
MGRSVMRAPVLLSTYVNNICIETGELAELLNSYVIEQGYRATGLQGHGGHRQRGGRLVRLLQWLKWCPEEPPKEP